MRFLHIEQRNQKTQCEDGQSFAIYRVIQSLSEIYVRFGVYTHTHTQSDPGNQLIQSQIEIE